MSITRTSIEWTDFSANPIRARDRETGKVGWHCTKVSEGCRNCYAENMNRRFGTGHKYTAQDAGKVELFLDEKVLDGILRMRPRPPFVNPNGRPSIFLGDMNDLYDERVKYEWLDKIMAVCALRPDIDFQWLTKRPERMAGYCDGRDWGEAVNYIVDKYLRRLDGPLHLMGEIVSPLPSVWLGTSVENQKALDERAPRVLKCPAAVRFLSVEPMLGPVDLDNIKYRPGTNGWLSAFNEGAWPELGNVAWIIIGCESTSRRRPFKNEWAESVIEQCDAAGVAVFVKQIIVNGHVSHNMAEWPEHLRRREFPRTEATDGKANDETALASRQ